MTTPAVNDFIPSYIRAILPYWLLALAVFAVYGNIYDNVFLFDDALLIQLDNNLRGWGHIADILTGSTTSGAHIIGGFYRPVQILLYMVLFNLGDGSVFPFHLLNIVLQATNACLVYRLGDKLTFNRGGAFVAAMIWAVHPLHTEAVTYMSGSADPLMVLFCLTALIKLLPDMTPRRIFEIFPLFLLGLMSKETMVMFPALVMVCLFYVDPQRLNWRIYLRTWPLWAVSLAYVVWRMHAQGFDGPQTYTQLYGKHEYASLKQYADHPFDRVYTFLATLPAYLKLLVWPTDLHMERSFKIYSTPWDRQVLAGCGMILAAAAIVIRSARMPHPALPLAWGLLWFAASHAPDTGLLIPMNSLFLEHWMYLPSAGLFLAVAESLHRLLRHRPRFMAYAASVVALIFAGVLAMMAYDQNKIWHDPVVFYNNIFAHGEASARARNNLALYYSDRGEYPEAIEQFKLAIQTADIYAETHYNLALTYLNLPNTPANVAEAVAHLKRSIEIAPMFYRSYQTLGDVYALLLNDPENATYYRAKAKEVLSQQR